MKFQPFSSMNRSFVVRCVSLLLATVLLAAPICAQRPAAPAKASAPRESAPRAAEPTFDNLLGADSYKMYGEVRNIGQLMSTGGLGEIVDPIIKLAEPPEQLCRSPVLQKATCCS